MNFTWCFTTLYHITLNYLLISNGSKKLGLLQRANQYLSPNGLKLVFNTIVLPHFDYCSIVWETACQSNLRIISQLQKRAARILLKAPRFTRSQTMFKTLNWLPFPRRVEYHKAIMVYKCLHDQAPSYLCEKFSTAVNRFNTRSRSQMLLLVPKPRLEIYRRSFAYSGSLLWNSLPAEVRQAPNLGTFKVLLVKYLGDAGYCT